MPKEFDKDGLAVSDGDMNSRDDYPHPLKILEEYVPRRENMRLKGRLEQQYMPVNLSSVELLFEVYPELGDLREPVLAWIKNLEQRLTSVDGQSREEYLRIFEAMLSGLKSDVSKSDSKQSFYEKIFSAGGTVDE